MAEHALAFTRIRALGAKGCNGAAFSVVWNPDRIACRRQVPRLTSLRNLVEWLLAERGAEVTVKLNLPGKEV
jgi:hypothetical protein